MILACAGASEDVIVAGILHDTIEDSIQEKKVTKDMLVQRFGDSVAALVWSVTEAHKEWSWEARKKEALEHIENFSEDSLLLKSADILSNMAELLDDYARCGESVFEYFNAPKDKLLRQQLLAIEMIMRRWTENPLKDDLALLKDKLKNIFD
jgi:(p)ppGpp synthase/HD superfamily hydrolase